MKKGIILLIGLLIGMSLMKKKETVVMEDVDRIEWLRDGQTAERNAAVQVGSFFVSERSTVYGADCTGCPLNDGIGLTSSQIELTTDSVRQSDGTWKKGVTYDGYYLVASDAALPMCTVLKVSSHSYEGSGIKKGVPFYALVVDRGSMIQENCIDLFAGKEKDPLITHNTLNGAVIEIIGFHKHEKDESGRMRCAGQ